MEKQAHHFSGRGSNYEVRIEETSDDYRVIIAKTERNNGMHENNTINPASSAFEFAVDRILGTELLHPEVHRAYFGDERGIMRAYQDAKHLAAEMTMIVNTPFAFTKPELTGKRVRVQLQDLSIDEWVAEAVREKFEN